MASATVRRLPRTAFALVAGALCLVSLAFTTAARAGEPSAPDAPAVTADAKLAADLPIAILADQLLKQVETGKPEQIWEPVNRLVRLGRSTGAVVTDRLVQGLDSQSPTVRLSCARALCQLNAADQAAPVLCGLLQSGASAELRRLAAMAIALTPALAENEIVAKALASALKNENDGAAKVSIARSLLLIGPASEGREALLALLNRSADQAVRDEAALALAEHGGLRLPEVRLRLLDLFNDPTTQGDRARLILRDAEDDIAPARDPKLAQGEQLVREIVRTIKNAYPDESKCGTEKLFEDAAKGMVGALDPYSQYLDREDAKATQEMLQQDYGGIGAYVGMRNGSFVIISPIYGSPADRAGLRALDIIQEVDGQKCGDMLDKGGMNSIIAKLKGKPGTPVKIKYYRRSFNKPVEVTVLRESIRVESVSCDMLPGGIGYIRLTRFGERSSDEMQKGLDKLLKEQHAKAIIFDLRDNPGGLLRAGVDIADKFIAGNKLLVYSEGNKEFAPRKEYYSTGGPEDEAFPLVVLVGVGSASASEIVAGALQDHKRATLVGEKTFGKGSVQQLIPLRATDRQTQLRLTIAKYYLPSGRCIHEKGVDVDVEAKQPDVYGWVAEAITELRKQSVFEDYARNTWEANKDLYARLAVNDDGTCENWPGFEDFYKRLNTRVERNDVRAELRVAVRRRVQDEQKKEMVYDLEEDVVLQRGILEALKKLNTEPETIAEYRTLPAKFKKKDDATLQTERPQFDPVITIDKPQSQP